MPTTKTKIKIEYIHLYKLILSIILCFTFVFPTSNARSAVSPFFNYQGRLADSSGEEVADGLYDITFRIYREGAGGTAIWSESWTAANLWTDTNPTIGSGSCPGGTIQINYSVNTNESTLRENQLLWNSSIGEATLIESVDTGSNRICAYTPKSSWSTGDDVTNRIYTQNGLFQVKLGSLNSLSEAFINSNYFLGITVGTDSEMRPRKQITSVPQAINANNLVGDGNIDIVNTDSGSDAASITYDSSSGSNDALQVTYGGSGGTGTALKVIQQGTGNIFSAIDGATEVFTIKDGGNVGIGTTNPSEILDVQGRIYLADSTTPSPTTNRLYAISGNLYWNGINISASVLPSGLLGQTLYYNGSTWTATFNLYNNGTNVGIGTTAPGYILDVVGASRFTGNINLTGHLIPTADNTYDLGSNTNRIRNLYIKGHSIHVGNSLSDEFVLDYDSTSGLLSFNYSGIGSPEFSLSSTGAITQSTWNGAAITVPYGGTGRTSHTSNYLLRGNGTDPIQASIIYDNGTNVGIGTSNPQAKFSVNTSDGGNIAQFQKNGSDVFLIDNDGSANFNNYEAKNFRIENDNGSLTPTCNAQTQGRMYYDTTADSAFVCIETAPSTYGWFDFTQTSVQSNKVVTVGSSGADYTTIAAAAAYLNALGGGIILLTPEIHNVNSQVDLENISLIGANTGDTRINITGSGVLRVKETQFKSMTIYVDSGISSSSGLDAKYNASTTSSIIFEWVDFIVNGTKVLINSSDATAPTIRTRFISTSTTSGNSKIFLPKASANLNTNSYHFVESQGGSGTLDIEDWNVKIAGSSNVTTSGTIETIPDSTIFVYPGMNLQGAINSISSGGVITILPGVHTISSPLSITRDDIQIEGYGDASIIRASGFAGGATVAAIQIGAMDGTNPANKVVLRDFKLEVSGTGASDIHGIRMAGGEDNQILNLTVVKTSGASGSGSGARMGIQLLDGTTEKLVRPVIKGCRVLGTSTSTAYFTDGIHVTGGDSYGAGSGIWTYGAGIDGVLVDGNYVDYVRETVAVFVGVNNSSLYNNRFSRMGAGGGGAFGIFFGNSTNVNMTANVIATSLSSSSYGIVMDTFNTGSLKTISDSVFTANTVDGAANGGVGFAYGVDIGNTNNTSFNRNVFTNNVINGASSATTVAIRINGAADDNNFSNNIINGNANPWDTGIAINSASSERNYIGKTAFINTTVNISDSGTATQLIVNQHNATTNPTANDDSADGYTVGTIWVNTSTQNAYIATSVAVGAAVWEQIDASGGGSVDLDSVYTADADKIMNVNNAAGLEFVNSSTGNIAFNLQSTGDFVIRDNNSTFLTIDDQGGLTYDLDATDNPSITINNLGTGSFRINDQSGDTTPFIIDQYGNVGIGTASPTDKVNIEYSISSDSSDALDISYSQMSNANKISGSAIYVKAASSGDDGDTLYGINIDDTSSTIANEIGLRIGIGWDKDIVFDDSSPRIQIIDGSILTITNETNNNLLEAKDISTNFGMALNAGAFMDRNSTLQEEFNKMRTTRTADGTGSQGAAMGDGGGWGTYESSDCNFSTVADAVNGIYRMQSNVANNGCLTMIDEAINNPRNIIDADNLPVMLMKVRPSNVGVNNILFVGAANQNDGTTTNPTEFIGFTNNGGNTWTGRTTTGGVSTNVACTGQTISITSFALLMVEVRSITDIRFYVDNNISDGINFTYCGASLSNVPTANIAPELIYQVRTGGTASTYLDTDFYRLWQDDSISTDVASKAIDISEVEQDLAKESAVTQMFPTDNPEMENGTLVEVDLTKSPKAVKAKNAENIVGVVTQDSGVDLNNGTIDGIRVATYGRALVKVSGENGNIQAGDYLTVSKTKGIAAKAKESGKVLGKAMEDFKGGKNDIGTIPVMIDIQNVEIESNEAFKVDGEFASTELDLSVLGNMVIDGSLIVNDVAQFNNMVFFEGVTEFKDKAQFKKEVTLERAPVMGSDAAGKVTVRKGEQSARINFAQNYNKVPYVQANWYFENQVNNELRKNIFNNDIRYIISNVDKSGFEIELNKAAPNDLSFFWTAFSPSN